MVAEVGVGVDELECHLSGPHYPLFVSAQRCQLEVVAALLPPPHQRAFTAQFEVHFCQHETVGGLDHRFQPGLAIGRTGCCDRSAAGLRHGGEEQQAELKVKVTIGKDDIPIKDLDCFNWGYDPFHFNAPEGSYASSAADGAKRVVELRAMVMALHQAGLRVGMDVVYNHTTASGQNDKSVLDRVVPGYYHRLSNNGGVERSTCCDNTATENLMMGKLMIDSTVLWAREYKIDSWTLG